jgi:hypothetical protein
MQHPLPAFEGFDQCMHDNAGRNVEIVRRLMLHLLATGGRRGRTSARRLSIGRILALKASGAGSRACLRCWFDLTSVRLQTPSCALVCVRV